MILGQTMNLYIFMSEIRVLYKLYHKIQKCRPSTLKEHLVSPEKVQELELGHRSQFLPVCKSV